jgi:hypothetical protein
MRRLMFANRPPLGLFQIQTFGLSNLLDPSFCIEAPGRGTAPGTARDLHTDQGSQFTDDGVTGVLRTQNERPNNLSISIACNSFARN